MLRIRVLAAAIAVVGVVVAPTPAASPGEGPYSLTAVALLGSDGTDVYLTVSSTTDPVPDRIDKVQLKALPFDGDQLRTSNYFDLLAPGGIAVLHVGDLGRHRQLQLLAHVKEGSQNNVEATTQVMLRPDLAVTSVSAPADVVRRQHCPSVLRAGTRADQRRLRRGDLHAVSAYQRAQVDRP